MTVDGNMPNSYEKIKIKLNGIEKYDFCPEDMDGEPQDSDPEKFVEYESGMQGFDTDNSETDDDETSDEDLVIESEDSDFVDDTDEAFDIGTIL